MDNLEIEAERVVRGMHVRGAPAWASGSWSLPPIRGEIFSDATFSQVGHSCFRVFNPVNFCPFSFCGVVPKSIERIVGTFPNSVLIRNFDDSDGTTTDLVVASFSGEWRLVGCADNGTWAKFQKPERIWIWQTEEGVKKTVDTHVRQQISWAASMALNLRYHWSVDLRVDGGIWIRFICPPGVAKTAFRLRDVPKGKSRRDALVNWVCGHRRGQGEVDPHLRGKHQFSFNGLDCVIKPSAFDRESEIRRKANA